MEQQRGMALSAGGWGGWMSDPAAVPPPSVYNQAVSGVIVNERSVLGIMTVASCLRVLGDAVGGLQVHVHRQQGNKRSYKDPEVDPPDVVVDPCVDIDREQVDFNLVTSWGLAGNAYGHIIDRGRGDLPVQIEILNPAQMRVNMVKGVRVVRIGSDIGPVIPNRDLIHIPWMSLPQGLVGLNPIEIGAMGFGLPIAMQEYGSRFFAQGMSPSGMYSTDKPMRPEDKERLIKEILTRHGGLAQSHTPIIMDSNAKWQQISVNPATAQLLEARAFSRAELCGFYGVPGHLVGDISAGGSEVYGKGLQEMVMGFALFSLSGYTRRADRFYSALLPAGYYVRRNVSDLFKTNDQMLGEYINALRMAAVATPNECREFLHLPPSKENGADSLWGPINSAHSDFMVMGGGALAANQQDADTGAASNAPRTPGNEPTNVYAQQGGSASGAPTKGTAASAFAAAAAQPKSGPTGPKKS
jgi:HK97 family phage portal protein